MMMKTTTIIMVPLVSSLVLLLVLVLVVGGVRYEGAFSSIHGLRAFPVRATTARGIAFSGSGCWSGFIDYYNY